MLSAPNLARSPRHTRAYAYGLVALLVACSGPMACSTTPCNGDACGTNQPDGHSGSDSTDDATSPDIAADAAGDTALDGGPDGNSDVHGADTDVLPVTCAPNHDQRIERHEVPLRTGLHATFKVANDADVDTAGTPNTAGVTTWDLSGDLPNDHLVLTELRPLTDAWFAADFPDADYITALSDGSDLLGIFQITDGALLMLGIASADSGLLATKLTYDPPVTVLAFPLEVGATWQTDTSVSGTYQGVFMLYSESYTYVVDRAGELATPFATFEVLAVRGALEKTVGFVVTPSRSWLYVSECFGTVGSVFSDDNVTEPAFTRAREVRRLAP